MRFIQVIFVILALSSCNIEKPKNELLYSNKYLFVRECSISCGKLFLPDSFSLVKSTYSLTYSRFYYKDVKATIIITFDSNPGNYHITELDIDKNVNNQSLKYLYNEEDETVSGNIDSNKYIYLFNLDSEYCSIVFEFDDCLTSMEMEHMFLDYLEKINWVARENSPVIFESPFVSDSIIKLNLDDYGKDKDTIEGSLFISFLSDNLLFHSAEKRSFENCDEVSAYYAQLILPYHDQIADGSVLTILDHYPEYEEIVNDQVLIQFIVNKNKGTTTNYPTDILSPLYLSNRVDITSVHAVVH